MALKYHPDKNPSTTPLFHVIHGAYERLIDGKVERNTIPSTPSNAASPTKPKEKPATASTDSSRAESSSNQFHQFQSKPNQYTSYRKPENTSTAKGAKVPKFEEKTRWGESRPDMAGDNDPLPGQNTYEGFRGYSQYPKNSPSFPSSESTKKSVPTRRKSASSINSTDSKSKSEEDTTERSRRRQKEYEAANKRIAERRARQQQRKNGDEPAGTEFTQSSFSLPIPEGLVVTPTKENQSSVDITWNKYSNSSSLLLKLELSWRISPRKQSNSSWKVGQSQSESQSTDWIVSSQLITTHQIRKKNLKVGTKYEFRLRYVLIKSDPDCDYQRGEWSEPVSITMPAPDETLENMPLNGLKNTEAKYALTITDMRARGLYSRTLFGISNPYIACTIGNTRLKTGVISHTNEPNWTNEKIIFHDICLNETLRVEVFDKELISRKSLLGEISISLSDLRNNEIRSWMILTGGSSEEGDKISEIYLSLQCHKESQHNVDTESGFVDTSPAPSTSAPVFEFFQLSPPPSSKPAKGFLHPVYNDSKLSSGQHIIGYLTPLKYVLVDSSLHTHLLDADWCYVQCHYGHEDQNAFLKTPVWGWSQARNKSNHSYFAPVSEDYQWSQDTHKTEGSAIETEDSESDEEDGDDDVPLWYQLRDEPTGYYYYYNDKTGESEWESPEWIEEIDHVSGSRYYTRLNPEDGTAVETTWSKPDHFARLIREMSK